MSPIRTLALLLSAVVLGSFVYGDEVSDRARELVERAADRQIGKDGWERARAEGKPLVVWVNVDPAEYPVVHRKLASWAVQIRVRSCSDDKTPRVGIIGQDMIEYRVYKQAIHDGTPERLRRLYDESCKD